jgi:hypothetical protein
MNRIEGSPPDKLWFIIPSVLLLVALLPLPYGYYTLLRIAVFACAGYLAYVSLGASQRGSLVTFSIIALLFNPIIPVHLDRDIWFFIDIGVAVYFIVKWRLLAKEQNMT